ncbi:MAG: barstar family protein [Elusimicrobia bacterium]|nr:barstar family protein [Elusimicrobiota bacterium]
MKDWARLLGDPAGEAVLRVSPGDAAAAGSAAAALGFHVARLDGPSLEDKAALIKAAARALRFPAYFGGTFDSLFDCLGDLEDWLPAPGWVIILADSAAACPKDPEALTAFLDTVSDAAKASKKPLRIVVS